MPPAGGIMRTQDIWIINIVAPKGEALRTKHGFTTSTHSEVMDLPTFQTQKHLLPSFQRTRRQLTIFNTRAKLYNKLGVTYARYGKYKDALKNLEKAISLDRAYFSAYNNLGNVYYLTGKYEEALGYYKKALDYSDNALILINVAKALYKLGNYENAKTYYLSAVKKKSSFKNKYAYLEMGTKQTEIRASDRARIDTMVEWDYD